RRLVPRGTLRAQTGVPAAIAARGLLTFAFFGADAYVPLMLTTVRDRSTSYAGLVLTTATLSWTAGSWVQARLSARRTVRTFWWVGLVLILAGVGVAATVLVDR